MGGQVEITCDGCSARFQKRRAERDRQLRINPGRRFYCSMVCYSKNAGRQNLGSHLGAGRTDQLDPANRQDSLSPFRYFLNKARNRPGATDLDLECLRALWEEQQGRCALSNLDMVLPRNTAAYDRMTREPRKASLDRIDPARGYVRGNVRFVTLLGNLARNRFSDADLVEFCRAVVAKEGLG